MYPFIWYFTIDVDVDVRNTVFRRRAIARHHFVDVNTEHLLF